MSFDTPDTPTRSKAGAGDDVGGVAIRMNSLALNTSDAEGSASNPSITTRKPGWMGPNPVSNGHHPFARDEDDISEAANKQLHGSAPTFVPTKPTPMSYLNKDSEADQHTVESTIVDPVIVNGSGDAPPRSSNAKGKQPVRSQAPVSTRNGNITPEPTVVFSTDTGADVPFQGSHYLRVDGAHADNFKSQLRALMGDFEWEKKTNGMKFHRHTSKHFSIYLIFDDIRSTAEAENDVEVVDSAWKAQCVSFAEWHSIKDADCEDTARAFDGQVNFRCKFDGNLRDINPEGLAESVKELAEQFGEVMAFAHMRSPNSTALEFRAEYFKVTEAAEAIELVTSAQPHVIGDWTIVAHQIYTVPMRKMAPNPGTDFPGSTFDPLTPQRSADFQHSTGGPQQSGQSPSGRSAWTKDKNGNTIAVAPPLYMSKVNQHQQYGAQQAQGSFTPDGSSLQGGPSGHGGWSNGTPSSFGRHTPTENNEPQVVKVSKIESGMDVRTTIMLRNLPNRWDVRRLKAILDATSRGKYDFSYLRIDFEYSTNVGYAFVNFTDPLHIIDFVNRYVGKEWMPNAWPRKHAAVSYATVQGYDCLVEKFRNSAIMDEFADYRPKLWWTFESAPRPDAVGTEKAFPPPNNASKKQRSADNATTMGLFPRGNGQRMMNQTRRSQYDRGTTRQIQEDAAFGGIPFSPTQVSHFGGGGFMQAPIGTPPYNNYYGGHAGYVTGPPMFDGYAHQNGYGCQNGFANQFGPPMPFYPHTPQFHAYGHFAGGPPMPRRAALQNPASMLRTHSNGRLAGRPTNVTVVPGGEEITGGPVQQSNSTVPRGMYRQQQQYGEGAAQVYEPGELGEYVATGYEDQY